MPKSYSLDLRERVLESYEKKEGTNAEIAKRYKMSLSTVKRIVQRYKTTGAIKLYIHHAGRRPILDESGCLALEKLVSENPDSTLSELSKAYKKRYKIKLGLSLLCRVLQKLNLRYKKKSLYASQRDREDVKKKRRFFGMGQ